MARIEPVTDDTATARERLALREIARTWGIVPNLGRVFARSLPFTYAVLAFGKALSRGRFTGPVAEQIAIAVANENRCSYCLAAHTAAGKAAGLDARTAADARSGIAADPKTAAALTFVQAVVRDRGHVSEVDLAAVRAVGWTDGDLVELVGHAIATTLTNYLHHLSDVAVDFPLVDLANPTEAVEAA